MCFLGKYSSEHKDTFYLIVPRRNRKMDFVKKFSVLYTSSSSFLVRHFLSLQTLSTTFVLLRTLTQSNECTIRGLELRPFPRYPRVSTPLFRLSTSFGVVDLRFEFPLFSRVISLPLIIVSDGEFERRPMTNYELTLFSWVCPLSWCTFFDSLLLGLE